MYLTIETCCLHHRNRVLTVGSNYVIAGSAWIYEFINALPRVIDRQTNLWHSVANPSLKTAPQKSSEWSLPSNARTGFGN
jgi:hypothetical protein